MIVGTLTLGSSRFMHLDRTSGSDPSVVFALSTGLLTLYRVSQGKLEKNVLSLKWLTRQAEQQLHDSLSGANISSSRMA